jgi:hypothetical protein
MAARPFGAAFVGVMLMVAMLAPVAPASAVPPPAPTPANARLQGQFQLSGRITVAKNVRGERVGQTVTRTWTFTPSCASGVCPTIVLVRRRATGSDQLVLNLRTPGYYVGSGRFFAPLRCGRRTWRRGSVVPFTIAVRVTAAALAGSDVVATQIRAAYTNRTRINRTPCVAVLGHDAAVYSGQVVPTTGGTGPSPGGP